MANTKVELTISGGHIQGVAGAQTVTIENFNIYNRPFEDRTIAAAAAAAAAADGVIAPCPYPGLAYFGPDDAARFFGREVAIISLANIVNRQSLTALVGASGSGKSSVVLAGLAPRLHQARGWRFSHFRVGTELASNPIMALARALVPLYVVSESETERLRNTKQLAECLQTGALTLRDVFDDCRSRNKGIRILLIADQFEEVFTSVNDETLLHRFIDLLLEGFPALTGSSSPDICLVLTLRADFYGRALSYRPLADALQGHVENLGPMNREELQEAIRRPAEHLEVSFEPGLIEAMLDELENQPGNLPLLQFALREMWGRLANRTITRKSYDDIGGLGGALARRADTIFEAMTEDGPNGQMSQAFQRLFTRLVMLGEDQADARRIVDRRELGEPAWSLAQRLADEDNRLVVTNAPASSRETVEIAHETLIRHWPRLVIWINDDRAFLSWQRQIRPNVELWLANPSDAGALLRGSMLAQASGWLAKHREHLGGEEIEFVEASVTSAEREEASRQAAQLAEIRLREQAAISQSFRLSVVARSLIKRSPETALLIAGEAARLNYNSITDEVLRELLDVVSADVVPLGGSIVHAGFAPDGEILTLSRDGKIQRFDDQGAAIGSFQIGAGRLAGGALSGDGRWILAICTDGTGRLIERKGNGKAELPAWKKLSNYQRPIIRWSADGGAILVTDADAAWVWDVESRQVHAPWDKRKEHDAVLSRWAEIHRSGGEDKADFERLIQLEESGHVTRVFDVTVSPDGKRIATAGEDGTVKIWDRAGWHTDTLSEEGMQAAVGLAFISGGLVSGHMDRAVRLWGKDGVLVAHLPGHEADVRVVLPCPSGDGFATATTGGGTEDGSIRLWDNQGGPRQVLEGHTSWVGDLTFSQDGKTIASGSWDKTIRVWTRDGRCLAILQGHAEPVIQVQFDPSGTRLLSRARDGEVRLWQWQKPRPAGLVLRESGIVAAATYWGGALVVSSGFDGTTTVVQLPDNTVRLVLPGMSARRIGAEQTMISDDRVWTMETEKYLGTIDLGRSATIHCAVRGPGSAIVRGPSLAVPPGDVGDEVKSLLPSPRGDTLLLMRARTATLISVDAQRCIRLEGPNYNTREAPSVDHAAFSSDGRYIVTASINGSMWVWSETGTLLAGRLIDGSGARDNLYSIAVSPAGGVVLTTIRGQADLWNLGLSHVVTLTCRTNKVKRGLFSPDGSRILTVAEAAIPDMRLWDRAGHLIATLPFNTGSDPASVVFVRETNLIIWPEGRTLHVYDYDGREIARLATALDEAIRVFAVDPGGRRIAIGSYGSEIQLWSLESGGMLLATLRGHTAEINSVQFSQDGRRLLAASSDHTVREFIIDAETLIADASSRVARMLTEEETDRYAIPRPLRFGPLAETAGQA